VMFVVAAGVIVLLYEWVGSTLLDTGGSVG
jgi:hypothetical protein